MDSGKLRETLKQAEGTKLKPYVDTVGKLTIGTGRNLADNGISLAEADYLLTNDILAAWSQVTATWPWVLTLSDVRQRVLCEMVFQLGVGGVGAFKNALNAMVRGDFEMAADEMLDSRWAKDQTPSRAQRLALMMRRDLD